MGNDDITQEIVPEIPATFDAIIGRVRNMLAYGMTDQEIVEKFVDDGFPLMEVVLTVQAGKLPF